MGAVSSAWCAELTHPVTARLRSGPKSKKTLWSSSLCKGPFLWVWNLSRDRQRKTRSGSVTVWHRPLKQNLACGVLIASLKFNLQTPWNVTCQYRDRLAEASMQCVNAAVLATALLLIEERGHWACNFRVSQSMTIMVASMALEQ